MTNEEAIIKLLPITDNMAYTDVFQDACKVAIEALKSRIPMKPKITLHGTTDYNTKCFCPSCGRFIRDTAKFCDDCGQAIDWMVRNDKRNSN